MQNSRKLNMKRQSRLRYRHNGQKTPADRWKKIPVNPIIAASLLPPEQRDWTCPFCKCGLLACESKRQRSLSIKHHYHYATKHKRMKLSKARIHTQRAKLHRQNPELQPRLQAGHASRSKTYKEKNRDVRDMKTGCHNLIHFDPNIETWPEQIKPKQLYSSVTCKVCWRFGRYSSFRQPCKPLSSRQGLRTWPILDLTNKKFLQVCGMLNLNKRKPTCPRFLLRSAKSSPPPPLTDSSKKVSSLIRARVKCLHRKTSSKYLELPRSQRF